jgi:PKD repeat protein
LTATAPYHGAPRLEPPTADFTSSCTDLDCSFTDQSSDSDGIIASWSWDFGDGASSSAKNPAHSYAAAGTFDVGLTVSDNDGASDSQSHNVVVTDPSAIPFLINAGISDAWFFPATGGQGFFIIVWEGSKTIFLAWFTFDTERPPDDVMALLGEPGHRWIIGLGPYDGDTALLDVFLSSGMIFDSGVPPVDTVQYPGATIEIVWSSCSEGLVKYNIPSLMLVGEVPIQRIVEDKVPACLAAQAQ